MNQQSADPSQPPASPNDMPMDESFPPARSMAMFGHAPAFRLSYIPDSLAESFMGDEYEAILGDLLTPRYTIDHNGIPSLFPDGSGAQAETAWSRLGEILGETESISDSESVGNMDALQFIEPEPDTTEPVPGETRAGWSEMSRKLPCVSSLRVANVLLTGCSQPRSLWLWRRSETAAHISPPDHLDLAVAAQSLSLLRSGLSSLRSRTRLKRVLCRSRRLQRRSEVRFPLRLTADLPWMR